LAAIPTGAGRSGYRSIICSSSHSKNECPTGSDRFLTIKEVASELSRRLTRLFLKGTDGQRPVLKYHPKLATDPQFRDYVLFHEYFHGDTGRGAGASHQTGWTGLVAKLIQANPA
jgi:hypothetical protein